LLNIDIRGKAGCSLRQRWSGGPKSYLGLALAGLPNLFSVTGPGSPSVLTNMLPSIEQYVDWITDCLNYMREHRFSRIEASAAAENNWWVQVQEAASATLRSKTATWYTGENIAKKPKFLCPILAVFMSILETVQKLSMRAMKVLCLVDTACLTGRYIW
jgi:cyclohexanone monooxygenase